MILGGIPGRREATGAGVAVTVGEALKVLGMKARGARFVFGSDHSISTNTDYEDFRYMVEVYREHMLY